MGGALGHLLNLTTCQSLPCGERGGLEIRCVTIRISKKGNGAHKIWERDPEKETRDTEGRLRVS